MSQRRRHPKPDRRRALELLASCRGGCTEAIMLAHGFTIEVARARGSRRQGTVAHVTRTATSILIFIVLTAAASVAAERVPLPPKVLG
jgi:hypothetical protein